MIYEVIRGLALGGAETLLVLRIEQLAREGAVLPEVLNSHRGHRFFESRLEAAGAEVHSLQRHSALFGLVELARWGRSLGPGDIVVCHSPAPAVALKLVKATRPRSFTLVEVAHNTHYRPIYRLAGRLMNRFADACISVSSQVNTAVTTTNFKEKRVILAGVDRQAMRHWLADNTSALLDLRETLGVGAAGRLLCAVGSLTPVKNHQALVRAMASLGDDAVRLVIVGEGPERASLEKLIGQLGLGDRVRLVGRQPEAWRWIAAADILVHPSKWEGLPVTLLEGLVLDVRVLTTAVGGISDLLPRAANIEVMGDPTPAGIAACIERHLRGLPAIDAVIARRGSSASYWDVERYTHEVAAYVSEVHSRASATRR